MQALIHLLVSHDAHCTDIAPRLVVAGKVGSYLRAEREGCFAVECFWGALGLGRPGLVSDVCVVVFLEPYRLHLARLACTDYYWSAQAGLGDGPGPCGLHVALLSSDGVQEYSCGFHKLVPGPLKLHCALEWASVHAFGMELAIVWAFDAQENGFRLHYSWTTHRLHSTL